MSASITEAAAGEGACTAYHNKSTGQSQPLQLQLDDAVVTGRISTRESRSLTHLALVSGYFWQRHLEYDHVRILGEGGNGCRNRSRICEEWVRVVRHHKIVESEAGRIEYIELLHGVVQSSEVDSVRPGDGHLEEVHPLQENRTVDRWKVLFQQSSKLLLPHTQQEHTRTRTKQVTAIRTGFSEPNSARRMAGR